MFLVKLFIKLKALFFRYFVSENKPVLAKKIKLKYPVLFMGKGIIKIGTKSVLGYFPSAKYFGTTGYIEARHEESIIEIGERTKINNDFSIIANNTQIKIGSDCDIGVGFKCIDSDFHGIKLEDRHNEEKVVNKPVTIGDKCFIGDNVTVLKGVTLGENCIVGVGSVVTKSFEANSIIAGNPAHLIKNILKEL